jgi:glycosyltransferase involved in cell wall biosynthesis
MQRVLAFNKFYLPGYQAGGPIVSLANMVVALGGEISFHIVTTDRDINDNVTYPQIIPDTWMQQGNARVRYLPASLSSTARLEKVVKEVRPQVVYLNSFFDTRFSSKLLLAHSVSRLPECRVILAPRGEFSKGALAIKPLRKRSYIAALKGLGFLRDVEWHASTSFEAEEIRSALRLPERAKVHVAPDLGSGPAGGVAGLWQPRQSGAPLRICFLSRISPMKNLLGAIRSLARMYMPAHLDILGPIEDLEYWNECEKAFATLPSHVSVSYQGAVPPPRIHDTLAPYDAFFLPTRGENYGHVIIEALSVGLPAIISNKTPWRGLSGLGVGYDGPLDEGAFAVELDRIAALGVHEMRTLREVCRQYARKVLESPLAIEANRRLFAV